MITSFQCYYCGRWGALAPWTTEEGVGYVPNCWGTYCEDLAEKDACRQREAMKEHDDHGAK